MILMLVLIAIIIGLSIWLATCLTSKDRFTAPKGTFFIYPEALGFGVPDFPGLPSNSVVSAKFAEVAVVLPYDSPVGPPKVTYDKSPVWTAVKKQYPQLTVKLWIALYFGSDGDFCDCNSTSTSCESQKPTSAACDKEIGVLETNFDLAQAAGILFDNEVTGTKHPKKIVATMESLQAKYPKLQLAWTGALCEAQFDKPPAPSICTGGGGTPVWNFCLAQLYTDSTLAFYGSPASPTCPDLLTFAKTFWQEFNKRTAVGKYSLSRTVPMVCGAGNCQELPNDDNTFCLDERLSPAVIEKLITSCPTDNFAVWYGTIDNKNSWKIMEKSPWKIPTKDITSGCQTTGHKLCVKGCCTSWKYLPK